MSEFLYIAAARDLVCAGPADGPMDQMGMLFLGWRVVAVRTSKVDGDAKVEGELRIELLEDQWSQRNPDWMEIEQRIRVYEIDYDDYGVYDRGSRIVTTIDFDPWIDPGDMEDFYQESKVVD